jgi:hypothetical protein
MDVDSDKSEGNNENKEKLDEAVKEESSEEKDGNNNEDANDNYDERKYSYGKKHEEDDIEEEKNVDTKNLGIQERYFVDANSAPTNMLNHPIFKHFSPYIKEIKQPRENAKHGFNSYVACLYCLKSCYKAHLYMPNAAVAIKIQ